MLAVRRGEGYSLAAKSLASISAKTLRATLFGDFKLQTVAGERVVISNRRAVLILAILFLQPDHSIEREALAKLLWPDRFVPQAKASLRQCLHDLGRALDALDFAGLQVDRSAISLDQDAVTSDIDILQTALAGGSETATAQLLSIGNTRVLQGITLNPAFDEWLTLRREHIETQLKAAISNAHIMMDDAIGEALLEAARARFPALRTAAPETERITLAVLPFKQSDELEGDFYLADAILDELTSRMRRVQEIALAGRTSVEVVSGREITLIDMACELNVSYLIEGEVRRRPDLIEIRVALIEGQSGTEAWSDTITGSVEEFIESRKVIGSNVIAAICNVLSISQSKPPLRRMTANREAYTLFLQGRELLHRIGVEGAIKKSVGFLEQALEFDPEFAECWMELADAHVNLAALTPSLERVKNSTDGARCARRAIELDPNQGHAYSVLGVHEWTSFNPSKALDYSFEAYARDPGSSDVASRLASCLLYLGKTREAQPYIEAAVERDPIYARNYVMLTSAYLGLGDFEKALRSGERMTELGFPSFWLALALMALGENEKAVETYYSARTYLGSVLMRPPGVQPMNDAAIDAYFKVVSRGVCSGKEEDRAVYCQMIDGLHMSMADPYDSSVALPAIWMGHSDLAMKIYSECIHPANMFGLMSLWIDIDPIRKTRLHPDFMAFAEKIGMVEAWNRHGWPDLMPSDPRKS